MNDNNAVVVATAPNLDKRKEKKKRERRGETLPQAGKPAPQAVRTTSAVAQGRKSNEPADRFTFVLGPEEKALHDYLRCIFNPAKYKARVPASRGGFELYTQLWSTEESGSFFAGLDGVAVLGLCAPNWVENANQDGVPAPSTQVLGYTNMGSASIRSIKAGANYVAFPAIGANLSDVDFSTTSLDVPTDQALTAETRIRLVAMELRIHSVLPVDTAKGEVMIVGSVNPHGPARGGSLSQASWDDIVKTNPRVITRAVKAVPGWKSGDVLSIVAIPGEAQSFEMCQVPADGYNIANSGGAGARKCPTMHLGAITRGMTPGDMLSYEITYVWESELAKSNDAESAGAVVIPVDAKTLNVASSKARPYAVHNQQPNIHALPWIETLAQTNPNAVVALNNHKSRPFGKPQSSIVVHKPGPTGPTFFEKLADTGKSLVQGLSKTGYLSKVPVVGGLLQGAGDFLSSLFD